MNNLLASTPLTLEQIKRFKDIIIRHKGIYLTDNEAETQATKWLRLSKLVMLIDPVEIEVRKKQ